MGLLRNLAKATRAAFVRKTETDPLAYFEAIPQAALAVSPDGRIRSINPRSELLFGYQRAELLNRPVELLLPQSWPPRDTGAPRGRRKDGTEFPIEIESSFVPAPSGPLALLLVADIGGRHRSADELVRVNAALQRSHADLEQFVYVASHDLQEPLRMITSYLNLLERRYADRLDPDGRDFVRYAVDGAQRMRGLLDDLLHVLRAGTASADFRLVSSAHLFENAVSNLRAAIADATAIVTASPLPEITADAYLLTQVFQNLISNAIKFHAPGVRPQVHVWAEQRAGDSVTSGWVVAVRDNGIGIEPQHSARIFQVFERLHTPEEYPGSGVGLAIAQRIVERHGGTIWVDSQPGLGSTFYFSLPSAHAPCPIPDSAAAASAGR